MSDLNELNVGAKWYVAHTYTGYENKVKAAIERAVENRNLSHLIFDVKIPVTSTVQIDSKGREKIVEEKIFPAYVFVKMIMNDESWHIIRNITGVTGFVGPGSRPVPLSDEEAMSIEVEAKVEMSSFQVGDEVEIIDGFLTGSSGTISEVGETEITVIVNYVGREMPVSLDAKCVKKKQ